MKKEIQPTARPQGAQTNEVESPRNIFPPLFRIYPCSKVFRKPMWFALADEGWPIVAYWVGVTVDQSDEDACARLWLKCMDDVRRSDMLICVANHDETLSGALAEIGAALVLGKRVWIVGDNPAFKTLTYHPLITRVRTFEEILSAMSLELHAVGTHPIPTAEAMTEPKAKS